MSERWEEIRDAIVLTVRGQAKDFLAQNADAEKFLLDRAQDLAKLSAQYVVELNPDEREKIVVEMNVVRQTIELEMAGIAVAAAAATRNLFSNILSSIATVLVKVLPAIVSAL